MVRSLWRGARAIRRARRRMPARFARRGRRRVPGPLLFGAGAGSAWLATFLDKRRRHIARDRAAAALRSGAATVEQKAEYAAGVAKGVAYEATGPLRREGREYDDITLARKVESEIFRPEDVPKGDVSVNAQNGIVELRGQVDDAETIEELGRAAERVEGVREVHNLLHTPGTPPKHSPPSDPEEVRERAEQPLPPSNFAGNPATTPPEDEPLVDRAPGPESGSGS